MLKSLFGRSSFLDQEVEEWHLETWSQLLDRLGGVDQAAVVTPTKEFFPPTEAQGHARAEHIFSCVKAAMGMEAWPCRLEAQASLPTFARVAEFHHLQTEGAPNGTFRVENGEALITYAPDLIGRPWDLVATFAHELAHFLLVEHQDAFDEDTHELATDLTVVYAGMGVFGANTAFRFGQHGDAFSQGWAYQRNGYLSPRSWAFALAVFEELKAGGMELDRWLTPEIASLRRKAQAYLSKRPELLGPLRIG